jgi:hypothetical protein
MSSITNGFMRVMIRPEPAVLHDGVMTVRIDTLVPGDVVTLPGLDTGTLVAVVTPHPLKQYGDAGLSLVIWWLHTGKRWSFDALLAWQELTNSVVWDLSDKQRQDGLRTVILHGLGQA